AEPLGPDCARVRKQQAGIVVIDDSMLIANAGRLADLAIRFRLPIMGFKDLVDAGGLLAYGVDFPEVFRQSMGLGGRILKGAKPGALPIQRATKFELILILKT